MALGFGANDRQLAPFGFFGGVFLALVVTFGATNWRQKNLASQGATIFLGLAPIFIGPYFGANNWRQTQKILGANSNLLALFLALFFFALIYWR